MRSRFLCLGPNSALDLVFRVDRDGRVLARRVFAGGKAANAAAALVRLGESTALVGFAGGAAGRRFAERARSRGFVFLAVPSRAETRSTYTFLDAGGRRPRLFVEPGERVRRAEVRAFAERALGALERASVCVFAGSPPPGFPPNRLRALLRRIRKRVPLVVDTHGPALRAALGSGPTLLAPNELEWRRALELDGDRGSVAELVQATRRALPEATRGVVVSRGARGLLYVERGSVWRARLPARQGNATGSGDVVTAVAARALARSDPPETWLRLAAAAAALNLEYDEPARFAAQEARRLAREVRLTRRSR